MRQILKDWCNYCEGKKDFDKAHFYTLFLDDSEKEKLTPNDLNIIFFIFLNVFINQFLSQQGNDQNV